MQKLIFYMKVVIGIGLIFGALSLFDVVLFWKQYNSLDILERAEMSRSFVEAIGIIIAGFWTYELYIKNRYDHPYPKIQHRIQHFHLKDGIIYLSVFVSVTNEGKTKLDLGGGIILIRQVVPITDNIARLIGEDSEKMNGEIIRNGKTPDLFIDAGQRIGWLTLGEREWKQLRGKLKELEPGQTREIQFDFLLVNEDDIKVIEAISYFEYTKSSWEYVTFHGLR